MNNEITMTDERGMVQPTEKKGFFIFINLLF